MSGSRGTGDARHLDHLDGRLREALRGGPLAPPGPAARRDLLASLRRRRARRRLGVLGSVAVVALAAGAAAYAWSAPGGGTTTAAGPPGAVATTAPPATPGAPAGHGPPFGVAQAPAGSLATGAGTGAGSGAGAGTGSGSDAGAGTALASCVRVRVQGTPARCAGTYSGAGAGAPGAPGALRAPGAPAGTGPVNGAAGPATGHRAAYGTAGTATVRVGRTITVLLPAAAGVAWGPVHVEEGATRGTPARAAVLRAVGPGATAPVAGSPVTFVAARRGLATLTARTGRRCSVAASQCSATGISWSLPVRVDGP